MEAQIISFSFLAEWSGRLGAGVRNNIVTLSMVISPFYRGWWITVSSILYTEGKTLKHFRYLGKKYISLNNCKSLGSGHKREGKAAGPIG